MQLTAKYVIASLMKIWYCIIINEAKTVLICLFPYCVRIVLTTTIWTNMFAFYVTHFLWKTLKDDVTAISCMTAIYMGSWVKKCRVSDVTGANSNGNEGVQSILRLTNVAYLSLGCFIVFDCCLSIVIFYSIAFCFFFIN